MMLLFAARTLSLTSCGKDDFEKAEMPDFNKLASYIDRDATAVKAELEAAGYDVRDDDGGFFANDEDEINQYTFTVKNDKITSADYEATNSRPKASKVKEQYKKIFDQEKAYRDQSGMTAYKGHLEDMDDNETNYTSKSEFIAAVDSYDIDNAGYCWSRSTYADIKTETAFGYDFVSYKVEKN